MAKILILCNSSGGLYDFRDQLLRKLCSEHDLWISMPDDLKEMELSSMGAKVLRTPMERHGMNPFRERKLLKKYKELMAGLRPDVVMAYTIKPVVYGGMAAAKLRIPFIPTVTGLSDAFFTSQAVRTLTRQLYRMGLKKAYCVFFQNQANMDFFSYNRIYQGKMRLVSGSGVNLSRFRPLPYGDSGAGEGRLRFSYINRVKKEKGFMEFLAAARHFKKEEEEGRIPAAPVFTVLGYCEDDLEKLALKENENGIIDYCGFSTDVETYYRQASCVVVPSYHEGMSNVLMEASASGRPVLSSDVTGCREIAEDGRTGFIFKVRDEKSLISAMERFMKLSDAEREQMGLAAREKMEREFDRAIVTEAYMEEIRNALAHKQD
ncbi:MAG: glycosyltransferase family 4 protein [Lachnospiraceae bacterium]|nr:glycosyltransferase family 4 protein [Lachnospiraceae bacterium]